MIEPYYADDAVTLYHGECQPLLPLLGRVAHVITDPPFGASAHKNAKSNRGIPAQRGVYSCVAESAIDFAPITYDTVVELLQVLGLMTDRWFIATLDHRHCAALEDESPAPWEFVRYGVWVKTNPMPQMSADRPAKGWDAIAYLHHTERPKRWNGGGDHGNWIGPVVTNGDHPTGKPLGLLMRLIAKHTDPGDLILDPFGGSGTTAVAAKLLGRRAILIERDERYCAVAARRLRQSVLNLYPAALTQDDLFGALADGASDATIPTDDHA